MEALRTVRGVNVRGKRVLLRVDCNVAVEEDGRPIPGGEQRLKAVLPTIELLRDQGARTILLTHLGRPGGRVVEALRVDDIARRLFVLLGSPVRYVPEVRGPSATRDVADLEDGDILLLENLRFDPGEEANDPAFARDLATFGDLYVNDAFGASHRAHASVALLPTLLSAYAGLLLAREVEVLHGVLEKPERPVVAIVGGAKLETKLALLTNLLPRVDRLLTGGGVANTLLQSAGVATGVSLAEREKDGPARALLEKFAERIVLPTDVRVSRHGDQHRALVVPVSAVGGADAVCDIGPETVAAYCRHLADARTCLWNGPLGKFEWPAFAEGTRALAGCLQGARTFAVVGGGDTVRALTEMRLLQRFDHVSTGGGAMLAYLEGAPMPGLEPLYEKTENTKRKSQN